MCDWRSVVELPMPAGETHPIASAMLHTPLASSIHTHRACRARRGACRGLARHSSKRRHAVLALPSHRHSPRRCRTTRCPAPAARASCPAGAARRGGEAAGRRREPRFGVARADAGAGQDGGRGWRGVLARGGQSAAMQGADARVAPWRAPQGAPAPSRVMRAWQHRMHGDGAGAGNGRPVCRHDAMLTILTHRASPSATGWQSEPLCHRLAERAPLPQAGRASP